MKMEAIHLDRLQIGEVNSYGDHHAMGFRGREGNQRMTTTPPPSSLSLHSPFSFSRLFTLSSPKRTAFRASAVAEQEKALTPEEGYKKELAKPCELYVCNLPRLSDLFKPYGTVHSVERQRVLCMLGISTEWVRSQECGGGMGGSRSRGFGSKNRGGLRD
ncbi:uncharacterized protein A4U43_C07F23290 [Asparagus officinalis]|uniref:Uncharacterized protein n=1 Tax=Asparagus officinalis TaxID=4686 RepID=A0A5P1EHP3_ASPOF|nr:uncharacterized protein A4U43_C07F23290 [Asparagus officinalis]